MTLTGAKNAREIVYSVLKDACIAGDLSAQEALTAATDVFAENAKEFYKLKIAEKQLSSKTFASPKNLTEERHASEEDLTLVRIIWVDTSGQHRCRVSLFFFFYSVFLENKKFYMKFFKSTIPWPYEYKCMMCLTVFS
jgi:hypothetical protein